MSWTAPKTFTANSTFSAADLNTFLRDNMLETTAAKALTPGSYFTTSGQNSIAERIGSTAFVNTAETSTSTSYVNLATVGPAVTVATSNKALVFLSSNFNNTAASSSAVIMSFGVTGASTIPASDNSAIWKSNAASLGQHFGGAYVFGNLVSGVNTFTAKYRVAGGTGQWADRRISVLPL